MAEQLIDIYDNGTPLTNDMLAQIASTQTDESQAFMAYMENYDEDSDCDKAEYEENFEYHLDYSSDDVLDIGKRDGTILMARRVCDLLGIKYVIPSEEK